MLPPSTKANDPIVFAPRTPREADLVRLAARGRHLSVSEFVRIAVLRAACDMAASFVVPSNLDQIIDQSTDFVTPSGTQQTVAQIQLGVEWDFQRTPEQTGTLWFKPTAEEHRCLQQMKIVLGDVVHGHAPPDLVGTRAADWLREQAWRTPANRIKRRTGLSVIHFPPGSPRINDGVLILAVGSVETHIHLGEHNRKSYPGPGSFEGATLVQIAGGRWTLRYATYTAAAPIKKTRPAK